MMGLGNLIRRNSKLFFKDKAMFFTSLITPIILLIYIQLFSEMFTSKAFYPQYLQALSCRKNS